MYTQCPQCEAAFRITVDVLQQARGQVRCGSCDHAFNALDHLSEQPPETRPPEPEVSSDDEDLERSQLLETLDRLAGTEDVRIEDTGVEWRVVDDDPTDEDADEDANGRPETAALDAEVPQDSTGSSSLRWILQDGDEPLEDEDIPDTAETTQNEVLSAADFADADGAPADDDEPRYDDNTLLPDDFEEQHQYTAPTPQRRATDRFEFVVEDEAGPQSDLELSEPDDWTDLLEDLGSSDPESAEPDSAVLEEAEPTDEPTADGAVEAAGDDATDVTLDATETATPAAESPADAPIGPDPDRDEEIALVASQLDELLDTMGTKPVQALADSMYESADSAKEESAIGDPAIEQSTAADDEAIAATPAEAVAEQAPIDDPVAEPVEQPMDELIDQSINELMDEQVDGSMDGSNDDPIDERIDEAFDDIVDDVVEAVEEPVPYTDTDTDADADAPDDASDEPASQDVPEPSTEAEVAARQSEDDELELASTDVPEFIDIHDESLHDEPAADGALDDAADDAADAATALDGTDEDEQQRAAQSAAELDLAEEADPEETPTDTADGTDIDDELADLAAMTGNMAIDADMLRAMRDSEFAAGMTNEDGSPVVETIVMEGDHVSDSLADRELSGRLETLTDPASFIDTYITKKGAKADADQRYGKRAFAVAAGLLLLLVAQFVHHTRESLATIGAFNQTIGPLYQMLGDPITPNWDIKGWQFEATNGSTDESDSVLTIYSRLSNRAADALPYPIVHVALTDRFEEVIGSRMLDPSEYLAGNADPERNVPAGANFTAVITIASPADEATGFKLNVCYPASGGRLRCAIEDFKTP